MSEQISTNRWFVRNGYGSDPVTKAVLTAYYFNTDEDTYYVIETLDGSFRKLLYQSLLTIRDFLVDEGLFSNPVFDQYEDWF